MGASREAEVGPMGASREAEVREAKTREIEEREIDTLGASREAEVERTKIRGTSVVAEDNDLETDEGTEVADFRTGSDCEAILNDVYFELVFNIFVSQ